MLKITGAGMSGPDAIEYMEGLVEYIPDEMLPKHECALNCFRYAVARNVPVEPVFHKGRSSRIYDNYTCGRCGYKLDMISEDYCPNCGQRATGAFAGRRMTRDEQKEFTTPANRAAIDERADMIKEENPSE